MFNILWAQGCALNVPHVDGSLDSDVVAAALPHRWRKAWLRRNRVWSMDGRGALYSVLYNRLGKPMATLYAIKSTD
jgi:hypothetical protein